MACCRIEALAEAYHDPEAKLQALLAKQMTESGSQDSEALSRPPFPGMVWIPGGTFLMGSAKHYPEERPPHRVTVDGFWMDRYPVTNERFARFVQATGHVTFAEIPPNPSDYPGALQDMLFAGSLVFTKPAGPVDRGDFRNWWTFMRGADWRHPYGPESTNADLDEHHRRPRLLCGCRSIRAVGRKDAAGRGGVGVRGTGRT